MRDRYLIVVATIAASVLTACSDAAVDQVTAPPTAAAPVHPVANEWPTVDEANEASSAIGIQITLNRYFSADTLTFVVEAQVKFQWANDVSATVYASLIDKNGATINSSEASMAYQRFAVPVTSGDTTFVVRLSTNGIKCGLVGKSAYSGHAATKAIDAKLIVITLWQQTIGKTNAEDLVLPACPAPEDECEASSRVIGGMTAALPNTEGCDDAPAPPGGDSPAEEICYALWREFWVYDYARRQYVFLFEILIGIYGYVPEE